MKDESVQRRKWSAFKGLHFDFSAYAWLHRAGCSLEIPRSSGLLVKDMLTHPGSENHQWEGCKGLADLAARDSDGLSSVRRQGGIQVLKDRSLRERTVDPPFLKKRQNVTSPSDDALKHPYMPRLLQRPVVGFGPSFRCPCCCSSSAEPSNIVLFALPNSSNLFPRVVLLSVSDPGMHARTGRSCCACGVLKRCRRAEMGMPSPGSSIWRPRGGGTFSPGWSCGCGPSACSSARRRDGVEKHGCCPCSRDCQRRRTGWRRSTAENEREPRKMGPSYEEGDVHALPLYRICQAGPFLLFFTHFCIGVGKRATCPLSLETRTRRVEGMPQTQVRDDQIGSHALNAKHGCSFLALLVFAANGYRSRSVE